MGHGSVHPVTVSPVHPKTFSNNLNNFIKK